MKKKKKVYGACRRLCLRQDGEEVWHPGGEIFEKKKIFKVFKKDRAMYEIWPNARREQTRNSQNPPPKKCSLLYGFRERKSIPPLSMGLQRTGWDLRSSSLFCVCARVGFHSTPTEENVHTTKKEDDATTPRWRLVVHSKGEEEKMDSLIFIQRIVDIMRKPVQTSQRKRKRKKWLLASLGLLRIFFLFLYFSLISKKTKKT